jgi:preprotein translocase subunit SecD
MVDRFRALLVTPLVSVMLIAPAFAEPLVLEVKEAMVALDQRVQEPILSIRLTPAGREAFARFTTENVGRKVEMRIDGKVVMTPVIREPILGGSLQISGPSLGDVRALASRLSAGNVKIEVEVVAD